MRLFISYARVDKPICVQVVRMLDAHDTWYDHRIHVGQQWWAEIQRRLAWCDGLVYLISPESMTSVYCQREFNIAQSAGKHIFPVLVHPEADIPSAVEHLQCADLTKGLTAKGVTQLLNAILVLERQQFKNAAQNLVTVRVGGDSGKRGSSTETTSMPPLPKTVDGCEDLIAQISSAMNRQNFDRAVYLLKLARDKRCTPRYMNLEALLHQAEAELERQTYLRGAEREYRPIVSMVKNPRMRRLGCKAFQSFRENFPDYDPENIAAVCSSIVMPMLEWCDVPAGEVAVEYEQKQVTYFVDDFHISKYPITNTQFQAFVDAPDGYRNPHWWHFSVQASAWRRQYSTPKPAKFSWGDHPRGNVNWYEAMAFCNWFSAQTGLRVTLPTEAQWQRAAQGDDGRIYPWGDKFDDTLCNTREGELRMTSPVTRYDQGVSPYGVYDMVGNIWEWCFSTDYNQRGSDRSSTGSTSNLHIPRAVRGGSFISVAQRARSTFHFYLNPLYRYATIGFRIVTKSHNG